MPLFTPSNAIDSFIGLANPSAIRFLRFNADNTASLLADSVMRTALGLGSLATLSDGSTITALNASNLASGTVSIARLVNTQTVGNADATIAATTRDVILNVALTLPRTFTWPLANAYPAGARVSFTDMANTLTAANTATLARSGGDLINNGTSLVLNTSGASPILISDGISRWNVDIRGISRGGTGSPTQAGARLNLGLGTTDNPTFSTVTATGSASSAFILGVPGARSAALSMNNGGNIGGLGVASDYVVAWSSANSSGDAGNFGLLDLFLRRGGANTLYQRNAAAAQNFWLANTFTDVNNYERATFGFTANVLRIGTEQLGTGVARAIDFLTGGTARWGISTAGHLLATIDNTYDIGASGATRPRNIFVGSEIVAAVVRTGFVNNPDNTISVFSFANTTGNTVFGGALLRFGGTTNAFPCLKRSGNILQARLADDSGFGSYQGKITTEIAYVAAAHTATGYLTIYDSTGTAYKVAASL